MKKIFINTIRIILTYLLVTSSGCKKFVTIPLPVNQLVSESAFANDKSAIATLNGIYSKMMASSISIFSSAGSMYPALSADELYYFTASDRDAFIQNTITQANDGSLGSYFWSPAYNFIYASNSCIEGATLSATLSENTKKTVIGEALFIRAFTYFNLVNLFGDVPLILSSDYTVNKDLPRAANALIYAQMVQDLKEAEQLLTDTYPSTGRARPNKATVRALLAKIYLYQKDWGDVIKICDPILSDNNYSLPSDLSSVFLSGSPEAIWQLAPVTPNFNTYVGNLILPATSSSAPTYLITDYLLASFETGDKRKSSWVQARTYQGKVLNYPFKYKVRLNAVVTEYNMVFRLAEIYLMRSEAKAQLNDIPGSLADISKIRSRAGLSALPRNITQPDLLIAIQKERRIELFSEWGNRWFDLKRTQTATSVLSPIKPYWKPAAELYPIPYSQIIINPLLTQNEGY